MKNRSLLQTAFGLRDLLFAAILLARCLCSAQADAPAPLHHPWRPPFGLDRVGFVPEGVDRTSLPAFEADAVAVASEWFNPIDLGAILVPANWLLLGPDANTDVSVAAIVRDRDGADCTVRVWFESMPDEATVARMPLVRDQVNRLTVPAPPTPKSVDRDTLHVAIADSAGAPLWEKTIPVMLAHAPPSWPRFGATSTKLRYDAPISVRNGDGSYSSMEYSDAWPAELDDVVVSLPNGARFVFWRGSSYVPFWAGRYNTALSYEWAETSPPPDGFVDCVEPLMDKELRYGRVEIVESTAARVHVRWTYQSCDFQYKVWGDSATEDFYFYPDGFGTRVLTLQSALDSKYEVSEFIILTPQETYPLDVLPPNLVDVVFLDGEKRSLEFPFDAGTQGAKLEPRGMPLLYRVRLHKDDPMTAVYFHPREQDIPKSVFGAFHDAGQIVTPCYWGSHWPLSRGQTTGGAINDRIHASPAHNSVMSWAQQRPPVLREAQLDTLDTLGHARPMRVQTWAWLIGLSQDSDEELIDRARSLATPPPMELDGARFGAESYAQERRAIRLVAESSNITMNITPTYACVNPVFEIRNTGALQSVELNGAPLDPADWVWDGNVLWLNLTLREPTKLTLKFAED